MSVIDSIYRYPLKGFGGQSLKQAQLLVGSGLASDRQFALSNGQSLIQANGQWTACQAFVRLTKNADLSLYKVAFDERSHLLEIQSPQGEILVIHLESEKSINDAIETLNRWFPSKPPEKTQLFQAALGYWDHVDAEISIINIASVHALSQAAKLDIDPLRFRGNIYVDGLHTQDELAWLGKRIRLGDAQLQITRPIDRCSATSLDLKTGLVDVNIPALLARHVGHVFCGVYARVIKPGLVKPGNSVDLIDSAPSNFPQYKQPTTAPAPQQWPRFAIVKRREREDQHVDSFWLQDPLAKQRAPVLAGQHIRIHLHENQRSFWRAYTVSDVEGDLLRISVKRSAASQGGSVWLHENAAVGSQLLISGAFGEFTAPQHPREPIIFLSAGIGITPIVAMLKDSVRQRLDTPVLVLHACNSLDDLALWDEVQAAVAQLSNARAKLFIKNATAADIQQFQAIAGHMVFDDVASHNAAAASAYMCGPTAFMTFAHDQLLALGMQSHQIHREIFSSPREITGEAHKAPAQGPFRVTFLRQKLQAIWQPQSGSLLELAEQHDLKPSANCRSGACMSCMQRVSQGQIFHTLDLALPLAEKSCLMCCAVPQSDIEIDF
jgi:ferredoxin-NADP reductase/uncharacterized protein YcbX